MPDSLKVVIKGRSYEVGRGLCSICGEVDSVLAPVTEGEEGRASLCEHCVLVAAMAWRRIEGEVAPGLTEEDVRRSSTVSVLVARRRRGTDSLGSDSTELGPRHMPSAYEFLMVPVAGSESRGLPTHPVAPNSSANEAAVEALVSVGLHSWPALLETLHVGYTPRGRLGTVVLVRGYSSLAAAGKISGAVAGTWLPWPVSAHAGKLAGYYEFMEVTWALRLYRLCVPGDRLPSEVSVSMREVARRFVDLQSVVGAGGDVDSSMLSAYHAAMTADEIAVAELVAKFEEERRKVSRKRLSAVPVVGVEVEVEGGGGGVGVLGGDDDGDDSGVGDPGDSGDEDDGAGGGDPPPEPGFARSFPRR
jgi:hypothetical protein